MTFELDHVFVCANPDAPEAAAIEALGFSPGPSGVHRGQGSANRSFVFHNAYLELIWIDDDVEARSPLTNPIRLFERWKGRADGGCPFGICLRPKRSSHVGSPPFAGWDYLPQYVPPSRPIHVGANCQNLAEPMLFYIESASRPDSWPGHSAMKHHLGVREITRLTWIRPTDAALSPELQAVVDGGHLVVESGSTHTLAISFDNDASGQSASLAPALPLTFSW